MRKLAFLVGILFSLPIPFHASIYQNCCSFRWCGFYVGGNVGYSWGRGTGKRVEVSPGLVNAVTLGNNIPGNLDVQPTGSFLGIQAGYNREWRQTVFGMEVDFQNGFDDTQRIHLIGKNGFSSTDAESKGKVEWFGTVRARLGYTVPYGFLFFGTGGLAYGSLHDSARVVSTPAISGNFKDSKDGVKMGGVVGAGAEWAFCCCWSIKLEYLYMEFGRIHLRLTDPAFPGDFLEYEYRHRNNMLRTGINFHF